MVQEQAFLATVQIHGVNPYVDMPRRAVEALGGGGKVAVLVKVAAAGAAKRTPGAPRGRKLATDADSLRAIQRLAPGGWFRTTLVPRRGGAHRLYLDTWMRDAAGVDVGDRVRVTLRPDPGSRELPMPAALREALRGNDQAKAAWQRLAPRAGARS
jgi:hypothetical protein